MAKKKLTVKEAKLVKGVAEGKSKYQAALDAGYSENTAKTEVYKTLEKPRVQEALEKALIKHGIDIDSIVAPVGKALKATKVEIHGNGEEAFAEVVEDIELQLKGHDRAVKLLGLNHKEEGGTTNYNFINVVTNDKEEFNGTP